MGEPRSDWGQELKRELALVGQTVERLGSSVERLDETVKGLGSDHAYGKGSLKSLWVVVGVLLSGSIVIQIWSTRDVKSDMREEIRLVQALRAQSEQLVEQGKTHATGMRQLETSISEQKESISLTRRELERLQSQVTKSNVSLHESLAQVPQQLARSLGDVSDSVAESRKATEESLDDLRQLSKMKPAEILTVRGQLSENNLVKAPPQKFENATMFAIPLGLDVPATAVERCDVSIATSQSTFEIWETETVTLLAEVTDAGQASVFVWSVGPPISQLVGKQNVPVELRLHVKTGAIHEKADQD